MPSLQQRLMSALAEVLALEEEADGALTLHHGGTLASLRVVPVVEGLDLVSLTQVVVWDLPLTRALRDQVMKLADSALLGSVTLVEKTGGAQVKRNSGKTADVMLRYNFPGTGLTDEPLCTLILMVLDKGAEIRRALTT